MANDIVAKGAARYRRVVHIFDPNTPPDGANVQEQGFVHWMDADLPPAWARRAAWLLDPARVREAEQADARDGGDRAHALVLDAWRAIQFVYMSLNLQASCDPVFRAWWRKWFSGEPVDAAGQYAYPTDFRSNRTSVPMEDSFTTNTASERVKYDVTRAMLRSAMAPRKLGILRTVAGRRFMARFPEADFTLRFFCPVFVDHLGLMETCRHPLDFRGPLEDDTRLPRQPEILDSLVARAAAQPYGYGPRGWRFLGHCVTGEDGATARQPCVGNSLDTWSYDLPTAWIGAPLLSVSCTLRDTLEAARELAADLAATPPLEIVLRARRSAFARNLVTMSENGGVAETFQAFANVEARAFTADRASLLGVDILGRSLTAAGGILTATGVGTVFGVALTALGSVTSVLSGPLRQVFEGVGQGAARDEFGRYKPWIESAYLSGTYAAGPEHSVPAPPGWSRPATVLGALDRVRVVDASLLVSRDVREGSIVRTTPFQGAASLPRTPTSTPARADLPPMPPDEVPPAPPMIGATDSTAGPSKVGVGLAVAAAAGLAWWLWG